MFKIKIGKYKYLKPETKKPVIPIMIVITVLLIGTVGYYLIWQDYNVSIIDAVYMTVITLTTLGYAEIYPLNDFGRMFTMFIAITGIGSLFYVLSVVMENLFIMQLNNYRRKKKKMKEIEKLHNHIILIGYGRVGQLAASMLLSNGEKFVVIDDDFVEEDTVNLKHNLLKIVGNATEDNVLIRAGIEKAKGLIVATGNSSTTVFVVLSAKVLNPNIFIVARSDEDSDVEKLKRAGADRVVNPYSIGGQRMAHLIINSNVVDFLETSFGINESDLKIEQLKLPENCQWFNMTLKELDFRQKYGVSILAVIRDNKPYSNPGGNFNVKKGDQFIIMGTGSELNELEKSLSTNK